MPRPWLSPSSPPGSRLPISRTFNNQLWILIPVAASIAPGIWLSNVPLTAVPQRTALSHTFGGLAAGAGPEHAEFFHGFHTDTCPHMMSRLHSCSRTSAFWPSSPRSCLGYLTFTGSLIAAAKLQEIQVGPQQPSWVYPGHNFVNATAFTIALVLATVLILNPHHAAAPWLFGTIIFLSLNFGWMLLG